METGSFIARNITVLSSPTQGFTTVPLSHIVPLDTWQVLLLLHFPTCCDLLASGRPSEMQSVYSSMSSAECVLDGVASQGSG